MSGVQGVFLTHSAEETRALAEGLARSLQTPAVFLLIGELGAGKTVFAKGLAAGLDIDPDEVTSPSFTLVNLHHGRWPFYHIDLYRIDDPRAVIEHLGLAEILAAPAVVAIEWGEKVPIQWLEQKAGTPRLIYRVEFLWLDETTRQVTIRCDAPHSAPSDT
ncbi:MAG: tRNA (adenosine(37)-N6)-threonylcarbamoyltransferase complex ATPase subunit type 1 TsaE [Blastocatellia bacterium]|nr:tRNA (adenosine(37)-N6)-threonylcarbamoyltransferase complex ATPase subunit type 1 TsaE [Blastocatellia bacterium]MCS7156727.1 tRNA (adenosine(37)-N6)-threonylcarbamoyltransferase complex ATPase subunit type 1 TsaE [Blastocatellia bacterium]MCX7751531.1 tRNA (adenosine(37)-N6)-threonylcarbamoyltransferase complex ATPase subunit type 1 TsaE [Blastocatellia bacterium]MDW8168631.1 tRNA (adenosine(37)-N6)-threonylcarbamoyltransferase complex ATPase subunit type 1 TsaE [Acidobacteriota bacterium]